MKPLDIIVCIKPVPDPKKWDKLKLDPETMLLRRADIPAVINALDRHAIEQALILKARFGGTVSAVTMAPPDAADQLREAIAMGCDKAYLLTDIAFAGGDTLATARCLAAAIQKIGSYDLIFCGSYSLDGSTAQVGPQIAELLEIPDLTHAISLDIIDDKVNAHCKLEDGYAVYEAEFPVLATFDREANTPRLPSMVGIMKAGKVEVTIWKAADLGTAPETVGLKGSPTAMLNIFTPAIGRKGDILQGTAAEIAANLVGKLRGEKILNM